MEDAIDGTTAGILRPRDADGPPEAERGRDLASIMAHLRSVSIMVSGREASDAWVRWSAAAGSAWLPYAEHRDEVVKAVLLDAGFDYYRFFPREKVTAALRVLGAMSAYMVVEVVAGVVALGSGHAPSRPLGLGLLFMQSVAAARVVMSLGRVSPVRGPDRAEVVRCATYPMVASAGGMLCLTLFSWREPKTVLDLAMVAQSVLALGVQRYALKARPHVEPRGPADAVLTDDDRPPRRRDVGACQDRHGSPRADAPRGVHARPGGDKRTSV